MNKILDFTPVEWDALAWAMYYTMEQWSDHPDWEAAPPDDPIIEDRRAAYTHLEAILERMEE